MKTTKLLNRTMLATVATILTATSSYAQCSSGAKSAKTQHDIVDTAVEAGQFNTLVAAVKAAGLVDVLKSDGPFTVFAPTDEAFAKLPKGTLESLLKPENKDKLAAILTYHVAPGKLTASDVTRATGVVSANGQWLGFKSANGKVMVDEATVVTADIKCANGVIHVIDQVVLPEQQNIVQVAAGAKTFQHAADGCHEAPGWQKHCSRTGRLRCSRQPMRLSPSCPPARSRICSSRRTRSNSPRSSSTTCCRVACIRRPR